jgi:AcrR family transcriptional regulator
MQPWTRCPPTRIRDLPVTQRVRHHGAGDTPGALALSPPPGRRIAVTSVTAVTGGASAARRSGTVPDPAAPAAPSRPETIIRVVPSERPAPPTVADTAVPPAAVPAAPEPPAARDPARRPRDRTAPGARERRRLETRARIVDAAAELFAERGFDAVSVVEIAQRAGVVEKTVFNHFPVKEGLVFEADPPMRAALLDAVRRRPAGESVAAAAGSFVVSACALLGTPEAAAGVAEMARVVRGSRTLQIREREILGELTTALADLIAEETHAEPGALEPWLAAHSVLGLYAALLELARDRVLAGATGPELAAALRGRGRQGLSLLQFGLAGYAKRR